MNLEHVTQWVTYLQIPIVQNKFYLVLDYYRNTDIVHHILSERIQTEVLTNHLWTWLASEKTHCISSTPSLCHTQCINNVFEI